MNSNQSSILFSLLAALLWGASYTCLKPVDNISPYVIQLTYNVFSSFAVLVVTFCVGLSKHQTMNEIFCVLEFTYLKLGLCLAYSLLGCTAGVLYVYSVQQSQVINEDGQQGSASIVTAISSSYVLFNILFNFIFFQDYQQMNLAIALPGMALTVIGVILMSLSPSL